MLIKGNKILLGKRKNSHGAGQWSFPGGHIEWMEDEETSMLRELEEETGLLPTDVDNFTRLMWSQNFFPEENKHYITLFYALRQITDTPVRNMEPEKNEGWEWFDPEQLPSPLFGGIRELMAVEEFPSDIGRFLWGDK